MSCQTSELEGPRVPWYRTAHLSPSGEETPSRSLQCVVQPAATATMPAPLNEPLLQGGAGGSSDASRPGGRDLEAARSAYDGGDVRASMAAHQACIVVRPALAVFSDFGELPRTPGCGAKTCLSAMQMDGDSHFPSSLSLLMKP